MSVSTDSSRPGHASLLLRAAELLLVAVAVIAPRLWFHCSTQITYEDSLISLRYARNLVEGHGLVYNPGERVFGASTPLYVLLLSVLALLAPLGALTAAKLLCVLADTLTGVIWYRLIRQQTGARTGALGFLAAFGMSPYIVEITVSGMETSLVLLCLTLACEAVFARRGQVLGLWLGLLLLLRLDTAVAIAILLAFRCRIEGRLPWREGALMAGVAAPWFLFSLWYYGSLIPNSIPAKMSAYNVHMPLLRTLSFSVSHFTPYRNGEKELIFTALFFPLFLSGAVDAVRRRQFMGLALVLIFLTPLVFLTASRTLIFRWYMPPLLLPYYVVGALGLAAFLQWHAGSAARPVLQRALCYTLVGGLSLHTAHWLIHAAGRVRAIQTYEETVRKPIGLWLAQHTPVDALVSAEPIGYIGYYSRRRILDQVGLVSPGVIPFTSRGAGWFTAVIQAFQPDYIVERPHFLMANKTMITNVPMFATRAERDWFWAHYRPIRYYSASGSRAYRRTYSFVILKRHKPVTTRDEKPRPAPRLTGGRRPATGGDTVSGPR